MQADIKLFQKRYGLSNKDMANVCMCSLPTIQKWRSGDVSPAGPAQQLMRLLDYSADGDPAKLRQLLKSMNREIGPVVREPDEDLVELESSMTKVMDRLELMLETRRQEKELAKSEARYRSMVESYDDPICRWLPDTTLTYVNEAYAKLFSEFGEDLIGRKWMDFIPESKREMVSAIISDMIRRGEPEISTHESVDRHGNLLFQEWRDIPIKNEHGDVVELHSVGRDITELTQLQEKLEESLRVRSNLLAVCNYPVLFLDSEGLFLEMNQQFRENILAGKRWKSLEEMIPAKKGRKLRRLLQRVTGEGQMLYRLILDGTVWSMRVRLLSSAPAGEKYLAVFDRQDAENARQVIQTRLASEKILPPGKEAVSLSDSKLSGLVKDMDRVGRATRVDRIYVFTFDWEEDVFDNILEWCADNIEPHIDDLKRIPVEDYEWWVKRLKKQQWIRQDNVDQLPRTARQVKEILKAQGIRSILVAPFVIEGVVAGFVGFDQNTHERVWHEQEVKALEAFARKAADLVSEARLPGKK